MKNILCRAICQDLSCSFKSRLPSKKPLTLATCCLLYIFSEYDQLCIKYSEKFTRALVTKDILHAFLHEDIYLYIY